MDKGAELKSTQTSNSQCCIMYMFLDLQVDRKDNSSSVKNMILEYQLTFQMSNSTQPTLPSIAPEVQNVTDPVIIVPTSAVPDSVSAMNMSANVTKLQPLIFLQTAAAQGIAGTFAVAAILITVHQVSIYYL